jgi:hypothetical protein
VSEPDADRFLAGYYASRATHGPVPHGARTDASFVLDALEGLDLADPELAAEWRSLLERLGRSPAEHDLLPPETRERASAYLANRGRAGLAKLEVIRVFQAVGALSWRDTGEREPETLAVERVVIAPAHAPAAITVSSLVVYAHALDVNWYAVLEPVAEGDSALARALPVTAAISLEDDLGTPYWAVGGSSTPGVEFPTAARTTFTPAPAAGALHLDVLRHGERIVRVPLT